MGARSSARRALLTVIALVASCGMPAPPPAALSSTHPVAGPGSAPASASVPAPTTQTSPAAGTRPAPATSASPAPAAPSDSPVPVPPSAPTVAGPTGSVPSVANSAGSGGARTSPAPRAPGTFTFAFAGDVNFADRTLARLDDPATAFGVARDQLDQADLTMVNLETAITTGGQAQDKSFTFRAPPSALVALHDAGIDLATMANNHGADYGLSGLRDSLAAIRGGPLPVIGIGANADAAYAPFRTTVNGVRVAVFAATQVHDETLANWTAGAASPGVASAFSDRLVAGVGAARAAGDVVVAYIHWGTEYVTCPNEEQTALADRLARAGASAVIGTHAHVLQGAGWRPDGVYVAYGLSNYLWWKSFGNEQDDNGVLTLSFANGRVAGAEFVPAHLDDRGIPVPATGSTRNRIEAEWERDRGCAGLAASPHG